MKENIFSPFISRPALTAFFAVSIFYAVFLYPIYALLFIPLSLFLCLHFPGWLLKICVIVLVLAGLSLWIHRIQENKINLLQNSELSTSGKGFVESVLLRKNGLVVLLKTNSGTLRLTLKDTTKAKPFPGDSIFYECSFYPVNPQTVPGAFDTKKWLKSQNFTAYGELKNFRKISEERIPEFYFLKFRT